MEKDIIQDFEKIKNKKEKYDEIINILKNDFLNKWIPAPLYSDKDGGEIEVERIKEDIPENTLRIEFGKTDYLKNKKVVITAELKGTNYKEEWEQKEEENKKEEDNKKEGEIKKVEEIKKEEEINSKNKLSSLKNVWEEEEELTEQIPEDLDKKVLELAEGRELDLANSKKNKLRKKSIDILNEHIDDLYQKTINERKRKI